MSKAEIEPTLSNANEPPPFWYIEPPRLIVAEVMPLPVSTQWPPSAHGRLSEPWPVQVIGVEADAEPTRPTTAMADSARTRSLRTIRAPFGDRSEPTLGPPNRASVGRPDYGFAPHPGHTYLANG